MTVVELPTFTFAKGDREAVTMMLSSSCELSSPVAAIAGPKAAVVHKRIARLIRSFTDLSPAQLPVPGDNVRFLGREEILDLSERPPRSNYGLIERPVSGLMSDACSAYIDRLPTHNGAVAKVIDYLIYRCGGSDGIAFQAHRLPV